jgi:hypothetical protein
VLVHAVALRLTCKFLRRYALARPGAPLWSTVVYQQKDFARATNRLGEQQPTGIMKNGFKRPY